MNVKDLKIGKIYFHQSRKSYGKMIGWNHSGVFMEVQVIGHRFDATETEKSLNPFQAWSPEYVESANQFEDLENLIEECDEVQKA